MIEGLRQLAAIVVNHLLFGTECKIHCPAPCILFTETKFNANTMAPALPFEGQLGNRAGHI
jgi:hypothetical protein